MMGVIDSGNPGTSLGPVFWLGAAIIDRGRDRPQPVHECPHQGGGARARDPIRTRAPN